MGADVMRWHVLRARPGQNLKLRLRARRRGQAAAAHALELGLVLRHVREHRGLRAASDWRSRPSRQAARPLARSRATQQLVAEATDAYERYWTPAVTRAFEAFVDDLSNWYIRRSRRRFWDGDAAALRTLWYALAAGPAAS